MSKLKENRDSEMKKVQNIEQKSTENLGETTGRMSNSNVNRNVEVRNEVQNPIAFVDLSRVNDFSLKGDEVLLVVHTPENAFQSEDESIVEVPDNVQEQIEYHQVDNDREVEQQRGIPDVQPNSLAASGVGANYLEMLRMGGDPVFKEIISQAVVEQMKIERQKLMEEGKSLERTNSVNQEKQGNNRTPGKNSGSVIRRGEVRACGNANMIKSPSDTTIYAPGLNRSPVCHNRNESIRTSQNVNINDLLIDENEAVNKVFRQYEVASKQRWKK